MKKPTPEELQLLHREVCSAINDPTRIAILYELAETSCCVSALVGALRLPQGTVSRHLKVLRERGIVSATREANRVRYALQDQRVIEVLDLLRGILGEYLERQQRAAVRIRRERKERPERTRGATRQRQSAREVRR